MLFAQKAWAESYRLLEAADREGLLEPEDLERLATAAYLLDHDADSETFRARAHQAFLDRGEGEGAARSASWLGFGLLQRGAIAQASGWFARAERILDEAHLDCVVRGYLLIPVRHSTHHARRSRRQATPHSHVRPKSLADSAIATWRRWPAPGVGAR